MRNMLELAYYFLTLHKMGDCKCKCNACGKEEVCEGEGCECTLECCGAKMEKVCSTEEKPEGGCCGGTCA